MKFDSKIICLDIDSNLIQRSSIDEIQKYKNLIKKISGDQNLVLLTNQNIAEIHNLALAWQIRSGYVIANAGSIIYDIGSQKPLFQIKLPSLIVKTIAHIATLNDLMIVIYTKDEKPITYKINIQLLNKITFMFENNNNELFDVYQSWSKFLKKIQSINVNSIEIFLPNDDTWEDVKYIDFVSSLKKIVNVNTIKFATSLIITPLNANRYNALRKICKLINMDFKKSTIYMGIAYFDSLLSKHAYFSITSKNLAPFNLNNELAPTILLNNSDNQWSQWLIDNDHLWAHDPVNKSYEQILNYSFNDENSNKTLQKETKLLLIQAAHKSEDLIISQFQKRDLTSVINFNKLNELTISPNLDFQNKNSSNYKEQKINLVNNSKLFKKPVDLPIWNEMRETILRNWSNEILKHNHDKNKK